MELMQTVAPKAKLDKTVVWYEVFTSGRSLRKARKKFRFHVSFISR